MVAEAPRSSNEGLPAPSGTVRAWFHSWSQAGSVADVLPRGGVGEELVGLPSGFGEVAVIGVQVALGRLDRLMAEDLLEDVQNDAGVGHPRRPGVPQPMPSETGEVETCDEVIPAGGVSDSRGGENASAWPAQQRVVGFLVGGETFEDGFESIEHRHWTVAAAYCQKT